MRFHSKRGQASPVNPPLRRGGASVTVQLRRPRARPLLVGTPSAASATSPGKSGTRSNASLPEQARAVVVRPKSSREQDGSMAAHHQFGWLRDGSGVACTMHVPRMYLARTWLAPPNLLPSTWLVPGFVLRPSLSAFRPLFPSSSRFARLTFSRPIDNDGQEQ